MKDPHIAQIYACFSDVQSIYLVMELSVDGNLSSYRKFMKTDREKTRIIMGIAQGL